MLCASVPLCCNNLSLLMHDEDQIALQKLNCNGNSPVVAYLYIASDFEELQITF